MAEVDLEATWNSLKAHTIIFIILIVLTNAGLIFKIARRNFLKFTFDVKRLTIVSLAIGDIFLALFTLVVRARYYFDYADLSCSTKMTSNVYGDLLINFVYGMGLVVLVVELIFRLKQPISQSTTGSGSQTNITAFLVSAIPWGLGLVIVLPLAMAGMEWGICFNDTLTLSRLKATYGVSLCLPASLAVLAGIFLMFVSQNNNSSPAAPPVLYNPPQNPTTNVSTDPSTKHNMPTQSVPAPGYQPQQNQYAPYPDQPPPYSVNVHSQPPNYPQQYNVYIPQPSSNQPPAPTNFDREKVTLCLICFVHFICVIPFAGYTLGYLLNEDRERMGALAATVVENLFYWLLFCRSVLAPLIWICRLGD